MIYPTKEDERIALARAIYKGLQDNPEVFPDPPVSVADGKAKIAEYDTDRATADASIAKAQIDVQTKDGTLGELDYMDKTVLDWAERLTKNDDAKLRLLNWGARAESQKLQPPSQPASFELIKLLDGGGFFDWKEPKIGGKPASYIVRRSEDGISFTDVRTVIVSEATLQDQPRGKKLWYQVVAINAAGESEPSNTVVLNF